MKPLPRYVITWSDGVTTVVHAHSQVDAKSLGFQLGVPAGVRLVKVSDYPGDPKPRRKPARTWRHNVQPTEAA